MKKLFTIISSLLIGTFLIFGVAGTAKAALVDVDAYQDSLNDNPPPDITPVIDTGIFLDGDDYLLITVDPLDMWSAGPEQRNPPKSRISNADGLGNPYGGDWGFYTDRGSGSSFRFGTLVGQIGGGAYFEVGTYYYEHVTDTGELTLFYWDINNYDNTGYVTASITLNPERVPEPASLLLLGTGLIGMCSVRRRFFK